MKENKFLRRILCVGVLFIAFVMYGCNQEPLYSSEISDDVNDIVNATELDMNLLAGKTIQDVSAISADNSLDEEDTVFDDPYGESNVQAGDLTDNKDLKNVNSATADINNTVSSTTSNSNLISDKDGSSGESEIFSDTGNGITYVLNKNTKKFHKPDCSSAKDMKPQNRKESDKSREELEKLGYTPCKSCIGD